MAAQLPDKSPKVICRCEKVPGWKKKASQKEKCKISLDQAMEIIGHGPYQVCVRDCWTSVFVEDYTLQREKYRIMACCFCSCKHGTFYSDAYLFSNACLWIIFFQYMITMICGFGYFCTALQTAVMVYMTNDISIEWGLSPVQVNSVVVLYYPLSEKESKQLVNHCPLLLL